MFVIVRLDGKFVAPPGCEKTYTSFLQEAWAFRTREQAEINRRKENERVFAVEDFLQMAKEQK